MQRVPRPQLEVHLQHNGLGVLGVQRPGTSQLSHGAPGRPEKVWGSKGAVEIPQVFATGVARATQLVAPVRTVSGSVAEKAGGQTASRMGLRARQVAQGAEARQGFGGRGGAAVFVRGVATFILTVALPRARKALPIPTQELIRLTAALTQATCRRKEMTA